MKKLIFIFLIFLSIFTYGQNISNEVIYHIKTGSAVGLSLYMDDFLELNIPGNGDQYSKVQAILIMKDFFAKNPPKTFLQIHQGKSDDGSEFYICKYNEYRCYFLIKKNGNEWKIQQLEFDPE